VWWVHWHKFQSPKAQEQKLQQGEDDYLSSERERIHPSSLSFFSIQDLHDWITPTDIKEDPLLYSVH
jgi:hypothetical protein